MVSGYMPTSLKEALDILSSQNVIPYGGGTDLMLHSNENAVYLFLHRIEALRRILVDADYVRIGGSCTFTEVLHSALVPALMKEAAAQIAAPAIRNIGTMAGNIGNGSAKADTVLIEFLSVQ